MKYLYVATISLCRPQVPGAIAGPVLGEAAHRLVKNTLNIKSNGSPSRSFDQPMNRNVPGNTYDRPRQGNGNYYVDDAYYNYNYHTNQQGILNNSRNYPSTYGVLGYQPNIRAQDKVRYHEQYRDLRSGMSSLTLEENSRGRYPAVMSPGVPNQGYGPNMQYPFEQSLGPPTPPTDWISSNMLGGNAGMYTRRETSGKGASEKQVKQVYQIKTRAAQDPSCSVAEQYDVNH